MMLQITNIGTTEFFQGKTMRWGLAWTFDPSITFPVRIFFIIRPPGTVVSGRPYVLLQFFILSLFFFSARSLRFLGQSPWNFATCLEAYSIL